MPWLLSILTATVGPVIAVVDWTVVLKALVDNGGEIITALGAFSVAVGTLFNTFQNWLNGKAIADNTKVTKATGEKAAEHAAAAKTKVEELGKTVNGRMDELLRAEREKAYQEGVAAERAAAQAAAAAKHEVSPVTINTQAVTVQPEVKAEGATP